MRRLLKRPRCGPHKGQPAVQSIRCRNCGGMSTSWHPTTGWHCADCGACDNHE